SGSLPWPPNLLPLASTPPPSGRRQWVKGCVGRMWHWPPLAAPPATASAVSRRHFLVGSTRPRLTGRFPLSRHSRVRGPGLTGALFRLVHSATSLWEQAANALLVVNTANRLTEERCHRNDLDLR